MNNTELKLAILKVANDPELLEAARKAVEDQLVERRDLRFALLRNNGLVIKERDGEPSPIIRMGIEDALAVGLEAVAKKLDEDTTEDFARNNGAASLRQLLIEGREIPTN